MNSSNIILLLNRPSVVIPSPGFPLWIAIHPPSSEATAINTPCGEAKTAQAMKHEICEECDGASNQELKFTLQHNTTELDWLELKVYSNELKIESASKQLVCFDCLFFPIDLWITLSLRNPSRRSLAAIAKSSMSGTGGVSPSNMMTQLSRFNTRTRLSLGHVQDIWPHHRRRQYSQHGLNNHI